MSRNIEDIFDSLNEEETGELLEGLARIRTDPKSASRVYERTMALSGRSVKEGKPAAGFPRRLLWALAAAAVLITALGAGSFAFAAEAKEFGEAKEFFEEHDFSMEGLTRAEIKAVYRDITTESFTYSKTAEVISHSLETNNVPGWEVLQGEPDPDDVRDAWADMEKRYLASINFVCDWEDEIVKEDGAEYMRHKSGTIGKYAGRDLKWSYKSDVMRFYFGQELKDGSLGVGVIEEDLKIEYKTDEQGNASLSAERKYTPAIMKFDPKGEPVWYATWDNGAPEEQISDVFENADGSLTVFSEKSDHKQGDFALCVSTVDKDGNYLGSVVNPTGSAWVCGAVGYEDGYLAILYDNEVLEQRVVRVDRDGRLAGEFSYSENGNDYRITDVEYFAGKLYVSAELEDADIVRSLYEGEPKNMDAEEFTPYAKEIFTAVLLVCDKDGGEPGEFYRVKGAISGELDTEDGRLVWQVGGITSAVFRPLFGSRSSDIDVNLWNYVFGADGKLLDTLDTGEGAKHLW